MTLKISDNQYGQLS